MSTENSETSTKVRDMAEKGVEQARSAIDSLLEVARSTSETIQSSTKTGELPQGQAVSRGFGFAKENIGAIFDFAQQLVRAPDLKSAVQIQTDFVKSRAEVMAKQVQELRELTPGTDTPGSAKS